ncbi:MAG: hypothetical protein ACRCV0_04145 [Brevinema sp.]
MRRVSHAQYILKSTNVNYLLENWAKGRLYLNAIRKSISTKTYPIKDAQDLLAKFNKSAFKANECQDLVIFANSLIEKKARVFTFSNDKASLEFLLNLHRISEGKTSEEYFKTVPKIQDKILELLCRDTFYAIAFTSRLRTAKDQAKVIADKLSSETLYSYYKSKNVNGKATKFYKLIEAYANNKQDQLLESDWEFSGMTSTARTMIESIKDYKDAVRISKELMETLVFEGTDHR